MSLAKLEKMIIGGKSYQYRNHTAIFKGYKTVHGNFEVKVEIDGETETFTKDTESKLELFLLNFKEMPEEQEAVNEQSNIPAVVPSQPLPPGTTVPSIYLESKSHFAKLTETLLADIEKVRNHPEYVNQAKQVCNNVSAIVNITKLQLQLLKND